MIFHQLSGGMETTFCIRFCVHQIIISLGILVKAATHRRCGKALTNISREMYKWSSTKKVISEYQNSDLQISGFAISSRKNIQPSTSNKVRSSISVSYRLLISMRVITFLSMSYPASCSLWARKDNTLCVALFFYRGLYASRSKMKQPGLVYIFTNTSTFAVGDVTKNFKF